MTERRIVMFNQVSADGFFSDPSGGLDWVVNDPELQAQAVAGMPRSDTILLGRRTYDNFAGFWPDALRDLNQAGPHGESPTDPAFVAMARWLNDTRKLVFSRTLRRAAWNNTEVLGELDATSLRALKRGPGKDILLFGSGSIVTQLSEQRLIDEYRFVVCPVLIGSGHTLFRSDRLRLGLELLSAQPLPSGNVLLTYAKTGDE